MATLSCLPNEILVAIFKLLAPPHTTLRFGDSSTKLPQCTKPDLCALSRCSRQIHDVVQPILMEWAIFHYGWVDWKGKANVDLFSQTVESNPCLARMVHSIHFNWHLTIPEVLAQVAGILKTLQALRLLELGGHRVIGSSLHHEEFQKTNEMKYLHTVIITDSRLTLLDLARYMFLGSIRTVILHRLHYNAKKDLLEVVGQRRGGTSPVLELELPVRENGETISIEVAETILNWPKALQKFHSTFPGFQDAEVYHPNSQAIITMLSPARLSKLVATHMHSLEDLLWNNCLWQKHDGTRMNLTFMTKLRVLNCPASLFFSPEKWFSSRRGFFELLPKSIERITLHFEIGYGISLEVYPAAQKYIDRTVNFELISRIQHNWLIELAQNKESSVPNLKYLHLVEPIREDVDPYTERAFDGNMSPPQKQISWIPPSHIREEFEKMRIELSGLRAVPREQTDVYDQIPEEAGGFTTNDYVTHRTVENSPTVYSDSEDYSDL